jgi:hypothetical protein
MTEHKHKQRYRLGAVAKAAKVPNSTLASWLQREQIELMKGDKQTAGTGDHRLFSWFRVINIAIVAELNRLGIPPSAGTSRLALEFSDMGETVAGFGNELPEPGRLAGGLFQPEIVRTWFVVRNFDGELDAEVTQQLDEHFLTFGSRTASSAVVIDMNRLVHSVEARLKASEEA